MKKRVILLFLSLLIMASVPLIAVEGGTGQENPFSDLSKNKTISPEKETAVEKKTDSGSEKLNSETDNSKQNEAIFKILDTSSGKVISIEEKKFCIGALAYEMPPGFEPEALKAQTVALYTFFSRKRQQQLENPDPKLMGADFSADLSKGEVYINEDQLKEKWGRQYDSSSKKIHSAVDDVFGEIIYDSSGSPIDACYHAISGGRTENAEDIFGIADSNLIAAASPYDITAPDYLTRVSINADDFKDKLKAEENSINTELKPDDYIGKIKRTPSGSVTEIELCGICFTGLEIRRIFSLRSAVFELEYKNDEFIFTVRGYGHGVGMSQWGAQGMALQGSSYREILCHYYNITDNDIGIFHNKS